MIFQGAVGNVMIGLLKRIFAIAAGVGPLKIAHELKKQVDSQRVERHLYSDVIGVTVSKPFGVKNLIKSRVTLRRNPNKCVSCCSVALSLIGYNDYLTRLIRTMFYEIYDNG